MRRAMMEGTIAMFGAAFGLSLTYNLVPGPVTAEALRRGARGGIRSVVAVRIGSLAGSLTWAIAAFTGIGVAVQNPHSRLLLTVAGAGVLLFLAWKAVRPARASAVVTSHPGARHGDALAGALIGLASPMEAAFWLGISSLLLGGAGGAERMVETGGFLAGFISADLLFTAVFALAVGWGRSIAGARLTRGANVLSVAALSWFAVSPFIGGW